MVKQKKLDFIKIKSVIETEKEEITHDVVGFTYQADTYCVSCGSKLPKVDPEGNEKHAILSGMEYEDQPYCHHCHEKIDVNVIFEQKEE